MKFNKKIKIIYGSILILISFIFLFQSISGTEILPIFKLYSWLGLSRNILVMIVSVFVTGGFLYYLSDKVQKNIMTFKEENQRKANSLGASLIISIMTLWCALVAYVVFLLIKGVDMNVMLDAIDFSNSPIFLNLYLFWLFVFTGLIKYIAETEVILDPEFKEKHNQIVKNWETREITFLQMMKLERALYSEYKKKQEEEKFKSLVK